MRVKSRILFYMVSTEAELILRTIKKSSNKKDILQHVDLFTDTKEYNYLINELMKHGIKYSEVKENVYSQKELDSAMLLEIVPNSYCGYPQPEDWGYFDASFDSNTGCKGCSYGRIQNRPIRLHKPKLGRNEIVGVWWVRTLIITSYLKNLLEQENLTGYEIWPVIDHKKNTEFSDLFQLYITHQLPSMSQKTNIDKNKGNICEVCGLGEQILKSDVIYDLSSLNSIKDFNLSAEWLGSGLGIWRAPFASQRVYKLFQEHNIKGVRFIPVTLTE